MRLRTLLALVAIGLFVTGCVPSLHPLYSEKDLVFDLALEGTWIEAEGKNTWALKASGENAYELTYTEYSQAPGSSAENAAGNPGKFEVHLARLGRFLFLDLYPEEPNIKNDFYQGHLIRSHTFGRIWIEDKVIRIAMLDPDWFEKMEKEKKLHIACEHVSGNFILTASTEKLQEFLLAYAEDSKAFGDPTELHRKQ